MRIEAIGYLVPQAPWEATVAGSYSRALVLGHDDGAAVAVVGCASDLDARAFLLQGGAADLDVLARAAPVGSVLRYDGRTLTANGLALGARGAATWDPRYGLPEAPPPGPERDAALALAARAVAAALGSERQPEGIRGDGPFAAAFARLRSGPGFPASAVGFGPGSTPAGDDWIAGYLCAADAATGRPGSAEPRLREAVRAALGRTTLAGRSLLLGVIEGAFPAYLDRLYRSALSADAEAVAGAAREALGHGASSGRDALDGFLERLSGPRPSEPRLSFPARAARLPPGVSAGAADAL